MRPSKTTLVTLALVLTATTVACSDSSFAPLIPEPYAGRVAGPSDPTATWLIPLDDATLSMRSDGRFSNGNGTASQYADGVCGVSAKIYATTQFSNLGDATIQTSYPKGGKCGRTVTLTYPDGSTQTLAMAANLNQLQNTSPGSIIAPDSSDLRRLILSFTVSGLGNPVASRCGRLIFGDNGSVGAGSDKLLVKRIDASTWHVQSQGPTSNLALCESLGVLYPMTVDFTIVASSALPTQ